MSDLDITECVDGTTVRYGDLIVIGVSLYARLLLERHPEWEACIETRTLRAVA